MNLQGIEFDVEKVTRLCRDAGVLRAWLFGSIVEGRFRSDSDIDLLVETDPAHRPGLMTLGGLQMDLSDLFGRRVHITMLGGIPESQRDAILTRARLLNAA
jgi:predicted nucleotidyltransferase